MRVGVVLLTIHPTYDVSKGCIFLPIAKPEQIKRRRVHFLLRLHFPDTQSKPGHDTE